ERQLQLLLGTTLMDTIAILGGKNPHIEEEFGAEIEVYERPFNERIDVAYIKRELEKELSSRDITSPFNLEIRDKNSTLYAFANFSHEKPFPRNVYMTELFRADYEGASGRLAIYFPNKNHILMGNMTVILVSSV